MPRSSTHRRAPSARHRPGFRVRLASGRDVETTLSHPFLTPQGWRALHDLSPGTLVAVPRRIPVFGALDLPAHEVGLLAYLTTGRTPPLDAEMLSARIARQAQHLLLRFGVVSVVAGNQLRIGPAGMVPLIREVGVFGHERLRRWARNQQRSLLGDVDVMWDPIVAIDETGAFQVYDLTVPRTHNFIANDVCVHNTTFCLNIAQHAAINVIEMRAKARKLKAEHGLGLIIIDYLQMMQSYKRTENRTQEISEIARTTKSLAKELNVPVIAISQLWLAVQAL